MCDLQGKSSSCLAFLFYIEDIFHLSLSFVFLRVCTFLGLREKRERDIVSLYSFLGKKSVFGEGIFMGVLSL